MGRCAEAHIFLEKMSAEQVGRETGSTGVSHHERKTGTRLIAELLRAQPFGCSRYIEITVPVSAEAAACTLR